VDVSPDLSHLFMIVKTTISAPKTSRNFDNEEFKNNSES